MNLQKVKFEEMDTLDYGLSRKSWEGDFEVEDAKIPLELVLTEYAGDTKHDKYFSVDIIQAPFKSMGDEFDSLEEALKDCENRIFEYYDDYQLSDNSESHEYKVGEY